MRKALLSLLAVIMVLSAACSRAPLEEVNGGEQEAPGHAALPLDIAGAPALDNGMVLAAENAALALYVDARTAVVAIRDKHNGELWLTNPADAIGDKRAAQLIVQYYEDGRVGEFNSAAHSAAKSGLQFFQASDGLRVIYTFSNTAISLDDYPKEIARERFEELLERAEADKDREELKKRYRYIEETGIYEARKMPDFAIENILRIIRAAGLAPAEVSGTEMPEAEGGLAPANLEIPLDYKLEGNQLAVAIDAKAMKVPPHLTVHTLQLLPYMGAAGQSQDGYLLVPDGSGGLIRWDSSSSGATPFRTPLYGRDGAIAQEEDMDHSEPARMPVFGLKQDQRALFAIIEQGGGIAGIQAETAGRTQSHSIVYSQFTITARDEMALTGNNKTNVFPVFPKERYTGQIAQRYSFLYGGQADYSGMAAAYRSYLEEKAGLTRQGLEPGTDIPFYASLVGSIPKPSAFLGVPYTAHAALTTFEEAKMVVGQLQGADVHNIKLRYEGWFNGGIRHSIPTSIKAAGNLGGKGGLDSLQKWLAEQGVELFPDVSFYNVYTGSWAFRANRDAARYISGKPARQHAYNLATYQQGSALSYILSPSKLGGVVEPFIEAAKKQQLSGLSLADLGKELHGDYRNGRMVDRESAAVIVEAQVAALQSGLGSLMVAGGNIYTVPYAKHIVDAPAAGSGFNIITEQIPFYQMVLHGYVHYAGEPLNLAADQDGQLYLLHLLEAGASPYVMWSAAPSALVKNTAFDRLYAIHYADWIGVASELYREANEVLRRVAGQLITSHRVLAPGVRTTAYESGLAITVNYNAWPVDVDGIVIPAQGYAIGGDGA